jgi:hypothetical protein
METSCYGFRENGMSKQKRPAVAICYDFDGTLSPNNMQEYEFIPKLGIKPEEFWNEVKEEAEKNDADGILVYMGKMLEKAIHSKTVRFTRKAFNGYGKNIRFFEGVETWFERINEYGRKNELLIEHYIVSSGIKEMIEGSCIARKFKKIFASSFIYDQNDAAKWPGVAVNYTSKTQFLFRISKGCLELNDNEKVNEYMQKDSIPVPFSRMIYLGDGDTDIPCMKVVKSQGGYSIAVYRPNASKHKARKLIEQRRADYIVQADYRKNKKLEKIIFSILDKIRAEWVLKQQASP